MPSDAGVRHPAAPIATPRDADVLAPFSTRLPQLAVPESDLTVVRTLQVSGLTEVLTVHATPDVE